MSPENHGIIAQGSGKGLRQTSEDSGLRHERESAKGLEMAYALGRQDQAGVQGALERVGSRKRSPRVGRAWRMNWHTCA